MEDFQIKYLVDCSEWLPTLVRWHHREWGHLIPGDTIDKRTRRMQQHLGKKQIPTTFVAHADAQVLGSASLVTDDMHGLSKLSPWLASVYVEPAARNRGVGSALVKRVEQEARALDVDTLYLFTPDKESFYARMGWKVGEHTVYMGLDVVIMSMSLRLTTESTPSPKRRQ